MFKRTEEITKIKCSSLIKQEQTSGEKNKEQVDNIDVEPLCQTTLSQRYLHVRALVRLSVRLDLCRPELVYLCMDFKATCRSCPPL